MKAKSLIIVFIFSLLFGFSSDKNFPGPADTPVALVKKIVKDVTYKKVDQPDWEAAKTGLPLKDGEQVKTGTKSLALILFTDGSGLIRVRESSVLNVYGKRDKNKLDKNTYIDKGLIGFDVNKQQDEEFKFTTPTAVASIRGTAGTLEVGKDSLTTIILERGLVEFQALSGERRSGTVTGGNTARIDRRGNVNVNLSTDADKNKNKLTQNLTTKKVTIKTKYGDVVLEYYSSEQ